MSLALLPDHVHTLVVGAGFGGIGMTATLLRENPDATSSSSSAVTTSAEPGA